MSTKGEGPLLLCYDGSEGARAALHASVRFFAGRGALVACYWQPFASSDRRFAIEILELVQNAASINEREEQLARRFAEEGAALVQAAGLTAEAEAVRIDMPIDEAILAHAERIDALAIVMGSRRRSTLRSLLLGNTANEIAQRSARPVLLAPSRTLAERRREEFVRYSPSAEPEPRPTS
jgi:nucleotide-binding universal stress UspA family protein